MLNYSLRDIAVIIPTYNRAEDLKITLHSFKRNWPLLNEILIIDQSNDTKTKDMINSLTSKKIRYIHTATPSLTKARNLGIRELTKNVKLVCFLDDDVTLHKQYFTKILEIFNEVPEAQGVSGYYFPEEMRKFSRYENACKKLFRVECFEENKMRVLSAYGATYPWKLTKIINTHWLSGFNMVYKREICSEFLFDANLSRYALGEDFDFSYRVYMKYPRGLFITPFASLIHRVSNVERMPTERLAYMNQINHWYFYYKNFNRSLNEKLIFAWTLGGILLLQLLRAMSTCSQRNRQKALLFMRSLLYVHKHTRAIQKGNLAHLYKS
jgi:GT2 family glycosyltransferase